MSALPEFPVAPSGGTGAGEGGGPEPRGWEQAGRGPAFFGVGEGAAGGECCSRSPCCILISAAAATPRGRPSIFHTKGRPPGPPQSPPHRPPPITAGQCREAEKGGDRHTGRDRKTQEIQAKTHGVGPEGRVRHSALEVQETETQVNRQTHSGVETETKRQSPKLEGGKTKSKKLKTSTKAETPRGQRKQSGTGTQRQELNQAQGKSEKQTMSPEPKPEQAGAWLRRYLEKCAQRQGGGREEGGEEEVVRRAR